MAQAAAALVLGLAGCGDTGPAASGGPPTPAPAATSQALPAAAPAEAAAAVDASPDIGPKLEPIARLVLQGRVLEARAQLEVWRRENPQDGRAAFLLGLTYHREKRYGEARPLFE